MVVILNETDTNQLEKNKFNLKHKHTKYFSINVYETKRSMYNIQKKAKT